MARTRKKTPAAVKKAFRKAVTKQPAKLSPDQGKQTITTPGPGPVTPSLEASFSDQLQELIRFHLCRPNPNKTLLCPPELLPPKPDDLENGQVRELLYLVTEDKDNYAKMLTVIMAGASVNSAVMFINVTFPDFLYWRRRGVDDIQRGIDSYFARFVNDVNFAAVVPGIEAESAVHRKNPLEWLRSGPGRNLHPEGTWQDAAPMPPELPPDTTGIAQPAVEMDDMPEDPFAGAPTINDLPEAIIAMRQSGLDHVIEDSIEEARRRIMITDERRQSQEGTGNQAKSPGANGSAPSNGAPSK